jgi:hypothetical protein
MTLLRSTKRKTTIDPVFICYATEDSDVAFEVVDKLERRNIPCWLAPRDIRGGRRFDDEIAAAIEGCSAVLLVFSSHSNRSDYIRGEVAVANDFGKLIIPFRVENVQPEKGLRVRLGILHWIDAFDARPDAIAAVIRALESHEK